MLSLQEVSDLWGATYINSVLARLLAQIYKGNIELVIKWRLLCRHDLDPSFWICLERQKFLQSQLDSVSDTCRLDLNSENFAPPIGKHVKIG